MLYQLNCRRMVSQWLGEQEQDQEDYSSLACGGPAAPSLSWLQLWQAALEEQRGRQELQAPEWVYRGEEEAIQGGYRGQEEAIQGVYRGEEGEEATGREKEAREEEGLGEAPKRGLVLRLEGEGSFAPAWSGSYRLEYAPVGRATPQLRDITGLDLLEHLVVRGRGELDYGEGA